MNNIDTVLAQNRTEVKHLLRRYRVVGEPNISTIQKAHNKHGENFMIKLLEIIAPTSNFSAGIGLMTPENPFVQDAITYAQTQQTQQPGKFWSFWDNLLGKVANTGATINQFKQDVNAPVEQPLQQESNARSTLVFAAAGVLVLVVVLILIFRK
jgi:hypothetical protein